MTSSAVGLNAQIQFKPQSPAQPAPSMRINGTEFKITSVQTRINGEWKDVSLTEFSEQDLKGLASRCATIFNKAQATNEAVSKMTIVLEANESAEPFLSRTLGTFIKSYKVETEELGVKNITFQTASSSEPIVFDIETEFDEKEKDQFNKDIKEDLRAIIPFVSKVFNPAIKPKKRAADQQLDTVKKILNVQDAGARENRCAALSVASILLQKHGNLQAAAQELQIQVAPSQDDRTALSNALITLAANTIETHPLFLDRFYPNIVAALEEATGQPVDPAATRQQIVASYAARIRQPGEMLDVPFFDALNVHGLRFITLVRAGNDYILGSVSDAIRMDEQLDLNSVCFVVHEGHHYQPVLMNNSPVQAAKLRSILTTHLNRSVQQLEEEVQNLGSNLSLAEKRNLIAPKIRHLLDKFPALAKSRIMDLLASGNRIFDRDALRNEAGDEFIEDATDAFLSDPISSLDQPD